MVFGSGNKWTWSDGFDAWIAPCDGKPRTASGTLTEPVFRRHETVRVVGADGHRCQRCGRVFSGAELRSAPSAKSVLEGPCPVL